MIIRFLGQSGYLLRTETTTVLIDPYLSDSVNRVAGRPRELPIPMDPRDIRCDAVICTHDHLDHLDPDTVCHMDSRQLFLTTHGGKEKLATFGKENVMAMSLGDSVRIGNMEITAVFADHTVEAMGLVVCAEGTTLYFSGDTLYNEQLFEIAAHRPHITFICINGRLGNMDVEQALTTARKIGAPVNVPNHYDMFASNSEDPHRFADHIPGGFIMEFDREYRLAGSAMPVKI